MYLELKKEKKVQLVSRVHCLIHECHYMHAGTVIGGNAMLGFYTVFNRTSNKVGFAQPSMCNCKVSIYAHKIAVTNYFCAHYQMKIS